MLDGSRALELFWKKTKTISTKSHILHGPSLLDEIFNPTFIGYNDIYIYIYILVNLDTSIFLCFSLVTTTNRQTSYDSGILRQDSGIICSFIGHKASRI